MGLFDRFKAKEQERLEEGLEKTRTSFLGKIGRAIRGKDTVDDEVLDNLEEALVTSDVGVSTTLEVIKRVQERVARDKYVSAQELTGMIRTEIADLVIGNDANRPADFDAPLANRPHVIMVVGVNGVGKTTSIGKIAYRPIIKQGHGADPAGVAFDTIASAKGRNSEVVIIDTAGRLHTKGGLMDELSKIKRVMDRQVEGAPHEVLLVLDASTGQNAIRQAEEFTKSVDVTGLVLTKLDGTAKGGIVIAISHEFQIPVKYIGVGEGIEDLQIFDSRRFVGALFN